MTQRITCLLAFLVLATTLQAQTVTITDDDLAAGETYNWTNDNVYLIDGYVYLEDGGTLNIEEGTRIEGKANPTNTSDLASTLIIARGATINAEGTAEEPIVFTAEGEDGSFSLPDDRGQWGGLVVLGRAAVGEENGTGVANIEGIPQEGRTQYGGDADDDNSGILRYVSIRYGGAVLADNNEINGLTLGGVGSGTTVEYIEVFGNNDDGIELFGGSVDVRYALVAFCKDDSFDTDQAWSGRGQFWFTIMLPNDQTGNNQNGGEHDGSENPSDDGGPVQTVYNATYIGMGSGMDNGESNTGLRIKSRAAISYNNSIFMDFGANGIRIEDESYDRYLDGDFAFNNNIWYDFGGETDATNLVRVDEDDDAAAVVAALLASSNTVENPNLAGISRNTDGMLDPRPSGGSPAYQDIADVPEGDFFQATGYRGAFSFGNNWASGWTHMDELGYFGDLVAEKATRVVRDIDLVGGQTYNWSADTIYVLDGYVFLESGGVLNIAPGTTVQGASTPSSANDLASALIIARGARINAIGTEEEPIVFTAEGEDGTFTIPDDRGQWGGLVILGNAAVGDENGVGTANVEGIPQEERTLYGGGDNPVDDDNSGALRYVSIRYGGAVLADNNEINGLTLGGVGSGTDISYIEVYGNNDDGIELFGGSVDVKYAAVIFCKDDSFDTDQSWSGRGQFWFTIMLPNDVSGNNQNGGEHDGSEDPGDNGGAVQSVWNATYIGMGADMDNGESNTGLRIKSGAAINYANSIFTEFGTDGVRIEDNSYDRFLAGDFTLSNNIWWNFGDGNDPTDFVRVDDEDDAAPVITLLTGEQGNSVVDPMLTRVNWTPSADGGSDGNGTDPRPAGNSPVTESLADYPDEDFYTDVDFKGAFSADGADGYWVTWMHAFEKGVLVNQLVGTTDFERNEGGVLLAVPAPNPATSTTQLTLTLPAASEVRLTVYDQMGRLINERNLGFFSAGVNERTIDVADLATGHYFLIIDTDSGAVAQRMVISR